MVQKWIGHDSVPFARGEDEEDDDGEGDGDLIEHEPERVQTRGRAQLGNEDLVTKAGRVGQWFECVRKAPVRARAGRHARHGGRVAYQCKGGRDVYTERECVAEGVEMQIAPAADNRPCTTTTVSTTNAFVSRKRGLFSRPF